MRSTRRIPPAARVALLVVNGVGILIASGFSAQGLRKPNFSEPDQPTTPLSRFWAASSAVRTWSLAVPLLLDLARRRPTSGLLVAAGLVQLGDSALGHPAPQSADGHRARGDGRHPSDQRPPTARLSAPRRPGRSFAPARQ